METRGILIRITRITAEPIRVALTTLADSMQVAALTEGADITEGEEVTRSGGKFARTELRSRMLISSPPRPASDRIGLHENSIGVTFQPKPAMPTHIASPAPNAP